MNKGHVVITGTGRAGTTFLVHLLTHVGLDTGFDRDTLKVLPHAQDVRAGSGEFYPIARAGLEMDVRAPNAPYIVKSPFLCDLMEETLRSSLIIEHAIVPVRNFEAAAASRIHTQKSTTGSTDGSPVAGGLWDTDKAEQQIEVLRKKFTNLIEVLVRHDVPITFLSYPRLVRDADYTYTKLEILLKHIDLASFRRAFALVVRPEWIHQFTAADK